MKNIGRPKKEEKRHHRVGLSLTTAEFLDLQKRAEKTKTTISDFAYRAVLGKEIVVPAPANYEAVKELNAIGRNINLIAKKSITDEIDMSVINEYLDEIREIKNRLMR